MRDYQINAVNKLREAFKAGYRKVGLMLATGGGKTHIAADIITRLVEHGQSVIFVCDRVELIDQASARFDAHGIKHGVIQANHPRWQPHQKVQVCSIQTLARRRWPHASYVIVDEFHTLYKTQIKMMEEWNAVKFIGLSATPFTKGLGKHWEHLVIGARTPELIEAGYLSPFVVYGPPPVDLKKVKTQAGDYNQKQLGEAVDKPKVIGDIVKNWLSLGENRQTICFAVNIQHSKHIVAEFNHYGIPAAHIDAYTDDEIREEVHRQFKEKEIRVISSVDVLTKGYDSPDASCLIMSRPTKSLTVYIQQFGRVLRIAEGKKNAIVLDHGGNVARHGFPTDPLPEKMDEGKKSESKKQEKKEPLPKPCPKCDYMKAPKVHACPMCGFAPERLNEIDNTDDKLVKIEKIDSKEKLKWFAMLLHYAKEKGYQDGWASHKYKEKFGTWPFKKSGVHPVEPNDEVKNYIKYLNIKNAKRRARPGTKQSQTTSMGGH